MQIRYCLSCQKELKGRSDKKFCDAQCRSIFHNKNRPPHELTIHKINSSLRKNRMLLAHFCPSGKSTVRKKFSNFWVLNLTCLRISFPFQKVLIIFAMITVFYLLKKRISQKYSSYRNSLIWKFRILTLGNSAHNMVILFQEYVLKSLIHISKIFVPI